MGRDYTKKDGKKTLLPTQRQLDKLVQKATVDLLRGVEISELSLASRIAIVREVNKLTPEERAKILLVGEATDKFIRIKAAEAIEGLKKDPNWVGKNERDDRTNPNNIHDFEKRIRDLPYEVVVNYDRHGRFMGYNVGNKGSVEMALIRGTLNGGTSMHNHPKEDGRPLGQHPSGRDLFTGKMLNSGTTAITSPEGKYTIRTPKGWSKIPESAIDAFEKKMQKVWTSSIVTARKVFPSGMSDENNKKYADFKHRLIHAQVQRLYQGFAKTHGIKYEFTPHKGYESLANATPASLLNPLP